MDLNILNDYIKINFNMSMILINNMLCGEIDSHRLNIENDGNKIKVTIKHKTIECENFNDVLKVLYDIIKK